MYPIHSITVGKDTIFAYEASQYSDNLKVSINGGAYLKEYIITQGDFDKWTILFNREQLGGRTNPDNALRRVYRHYKKNKGA